MMNISNIDEYIQHAQIDLVAKLQELSNRIGLHLNNIDIEVDILQTSRTKSNRFTGDELKMYQDKLKYVQSQISKCMDLSKFVNLRMSDYQEQGNKMDEARKFITRELYSMLPKDKNLRMCATNVRDAVIQLNYSWFGYVASNKGIISTCTSYEDKFQSSVCAFCKIWWKYMWTPRYRDDISFSVFFKPRIGEELERMLNDVQYSVRRGLLMEAAKQIGCHWSAVKYEDLSKVNLPADKMNSLKAIFGATYQTGLDDHERYMSSTVSTYSELDKYYDDKYNSIEDLLIHEMLMQESKLTDDDLNKMSDLYTLPFMLLKTTLPSALEKLHKLLLQGKDRQEIFQLTYNPHLISSENDD